ncbi:MAG TPA: winged helix-turn-helix transcriptional regulator [Nitrososphaeraceae archaeon]|nr:winged helix-turn-helix transcriptional regulator [Nitrososphaeraceae archaeon]
MLKNLIPPRVEYRLSSKGQELVESVINLMQFRENKGAEDPYLICDIRDTEKIVVNKIKSKPLWNS